MILLRQKKKRRRKRTRGEEKWTRFRSQTSIVFDSFNKAVFFFPFGFFFFVPLHTPSILFFKIPPPDPVPPAPRPNRTFRLVPHNTGSRPFRLLYRYAHTGEVYFTHSPSSSETLSSTNDFESFPAQYRRTLFPHHPLFFYRILYVRDTMISPVLDDIIVIIRTANNVRKLNFFLFFFLFHEK